MEDKEIVELFLMRSENALREVSEKYGAYLKKTAYTIVGNDRDAEECVNDTYLSAWNSIPPHKPEVLLTYLCKLCRNHALMRLRYNRSERRGGGKAIKALDEIAETVPGETDDAGEVEAIKRSVRDFVYSLQSDEKNVFLQRYFRFYDIKTISKNTGFTQSKVKMMLKRSRDKLKVKLEREGLM